MLLVMLTADIGAGVVLLVDDSVKKPTFDGALWVVTEQCKYSTLFTHAANMAAKEFIKSEGVTV